MRHMLSNAAHVPIAMAVTRSLAVRLCSTPNFIVFSGLHGGDDSPGRCVDCENDVVIASYQPSYWSRRRREESPRLDCAVQREERADETDEAAGSRRSGLGPLGGSR